MAQQKQQMPGDGMTDQQQESLVQLGKLMGDPRDEFDRQVEKHLAEDYPHEAGYQKMHSAQTGGSLGLGPTDIEQEQAKGQSAAAKQRAIQGAQQAQAAQAQAQSPTPPSAPSGPAGVTQPYSAQRQQPPAPAMPQQQPQAAQPEQGQDQQEQA